MALGDDRSGCRIHRIKGAYVEAWVKRAVEAFYWVMASLAIVLFFCVMLLLLLGTMLVARWGGFLIMVAAVALLIWLSQR